ncbi:MAG TPA: hypothetical protein PLL30_03075 [Candidatus Krumholzibacteria bacterium]|nr:hypothetical protein [Candidatus Krumholzibacteria bacterium]HPD70754.1 hypothetical protein [Candidatus Krumholzibacteria bacterium]HRY39546.1 hypothetical protein [Candidatus Krumholzibacteria bacterium]
MRTLSVLIVAVALGLGTGCVKMQMETVIESDGSGTCTVAYGMSREVADAIAKMSELDSGTMGGSAEMPSLEDMTRDNMEAACREAGVKLVDHQYTDDASGTHLTMKLAFDDVANLSGALDALGANEDGGREHLGIFQAGDGNLILKVIAASDEEAAEEPAEEEETADEDEAGGEEDMAKMQEAMQYMGVLMAHSNELDVRMTVTVPGDVVSSNAPEVEGRTSIWAINASNMMAAQSMDMEPEIVFSGKGLKIKAGEEE